MTVDLRYAIIIGIDQYGNEKWCLNTSVSDALKFGAWVIREGLVAKENLVLLLSPRLGSNIQPGNGRVELPGTQEIVPFKEATRREIVVAIEDLIASEEASTASKLFFYYAGHGSSAPGTQKEGRPEPVLIPADYKRITVDNNLLLGFSEIMPRLYDQGPVEQFFFVDACRDFALEQFERGAGSSVGRYISPSLPWQHKRRSQYLLYATSPGQRANEVGRKFGAGIFGDVLLQGLQKNPGALKWNPETNKQEIVFSSLSRYVSAEVSDRARRILGEASYALIQIPQADQTPGSEDALIASYDPRSIPPLTLTVRVGPSSARQTGSIVVSQPTANGDLPIKEENPPLEELHKIELSPDVYAVQAESPTFAASRTTVNLNRPSAVDFTLKPLSSSASVTSRKSAGERSLTIRAKDPNVLIAVWRPDRNAPQTALGQVRIEPAPAGIYKAQMLLPDGPGEVRLIEFPRDGADIDLEAPRALMGQAQMESLQQKGIVTEERYMQPSEYIGSIGDARVSSVLGFAAYATYCRPQEVQRLQSFGLKAITDVQAGQSWITVLVGTSGVAPTSQSDSVMLQAGSVVAIINGNEDVVARGVPQVLPGFPSAAEFGSQADPGAYVLELRLPGFSDTRYAITALADRVTVFVLVVNHQGSIDVQEYIYPLKSLVFPQLPGLQPRDLRVLDAAQRYYAGSEQVPAEIIDLLLNMKMIDPVGACLAGYELMRRGQPERYIGQPNPRAGPDQFEPSAMKNMLKFFADVPDSHILAGLAQPERKKEHFDKALVLGLPLFLEGFVALRDHFGEQLPEKFAFVQHTLLVGSPWTAWIAREPILTIEQGRFENPPSQWKALEEKRREIQATCSAVGALEVIGEVNDIVGTAFLISPRQALTSTGVASRFSKQLADEGKIPSEVVVYFNIAEVPKDNPALRVRVLNVRFFEAENLAVLTLESPSTSEPVSLKGEFPTLSLLDEVCIIGYPVGDSREDLDAVKRATHEIYRRKRLQPGIVLETPGPHNTFDYSCFTLQGNGGSPVAQLKTGRVVGVHWGGWKKSYTRGRATALSLATDFRVALL